MSGAFATGGSKGGWAGGSGGCGGRAGTGGAGGSQGTKGAVTAGTPQYVVAGIRCAADKEKSHVFSSTSQKRGSKSLSHLYHFFSHHWRKTFQITA